MLAAVILSGGASSRMGAPKALVAYQGRPFLEHLLEVTTHEKIGARRIVLGAHAEAIAKAISVPDEEIVVNKKWGEGQLSSLQAAIRSLPHGTDGLLLCLIDHPLISATLVSDLIEQFYAHAMRNIIVPIFQSRRGHPVVFPSRLYGELLEAPLDKGARAVVWAHASEVIEVPTLEEGCVLNLNDPETFHRATGAKLNEQQK